MLKKSVNKFAKYLVLLGVNSALAILLLMVVSFYSHNFSFLYFIWNLFLSWIPLALSIILILVLRKKLWSSWLALGLSFFWIIFIPNSFYMISDFIHLIDVPVNDLLYFAIAFSAIIYSASINGYFSLYLIHREFYKRFSLKTSWIAVAVICLVSSYAIYIGRVLRWNSWDMILNPGGVLFDISDTLLHFNSLKNALFTSLMFFILIFSIYILFFVGLRFLRSSNLSDK